MSKTAAQLATRVLHRLSVIEASETPASADSQLVQDYYTDHFEELRDDGLTFWEVGTIDERAFQALADLIAGRIAPDFGLSRPDLEESGLTRLRRLSSEGSTGLPVTGSFF